MKLREFYKSKELEGCTFKPKRVTKDPNRRPNNSSVDTSLRIDELYKLGIQIVSKKREGDRPKEEIEMIKNENFCTFKPQFEKYVCFI